MQVVREISSGCTCFGDTYRRGKICMKFRVYRVLLYPISWIPAENRKWEFHGRKNP